MNPERRRATRYPVAVEIVVNGGEGITANFSDNGVYFATSQPLSIDEEVSLVLPFAHAAPGARAACTARVLRVDRLSDAYGVAATYEAISFQMA